MTIVSLLVQVILIVGLFKNIRPSLIVWIVIELKTGSFIIYVTQFLARRHWNEGKKLFLKEN